MSDWSFPIRIRAMFYREADASYRVEPHVHNCHQWYFVVRGQVDMRVDDRTVRLEAEQSIILPPGCTRGPNAAAKSPAYMVVLFENQSLSLNSLYCHPVTLPVFLREDLRALIEELQRPRGANSESLPHILVARLLIGLERTVQPAQLPRTHKTSILNVAEYEEIVERVETFMRHNLHRCLTREDLAEIANMSAPHLARVFRSVTGKTLIQRLAQLRIQQASEMLRESSLPITEIALNVGFSSFSHFSQLFKRIAGVSPSEYRRHGGGSWGRN